MKRKYHQKLEQIDNEIDLEKRIINKVDILKDFSTRQNINPVNQNQKIQIKKGEEVQKKGTLVLKEVKRTLVLKEVKRKPNVSLVNLHLKDFSNNPEFYTQRNYEQKARIKIVDQNNMIQKQNQLNNQSNEGSQLIVSKFNPLYHQNTQIQPYDSQLVINQNVIQFGSNQFEQNNLDMNLNSIIQTKGVSQIAKESRQLKQFQIEKRIETMRQKELNRGPIKYPFNYQIAQNKINLITNLKSHIVKPTQTVDEEIHEIARKTMFIKSHTNREVTTTNQNSDQIFETITKTQYKRCENCQKLSDNNSFLLSCLHIYHIECLVQMITINIQSGKTLFFCQCQKKIPQKIILNLLKDNKQSIYTLFNNQLKLLIKQFQQDKRNTHIKFDQNPQIIVQQGIIVWK